MNATQVDGRRAWWSRAVLITGIVAVVLPFLGALGTRFGIWNFKLGLLLWAVGLLIGLICFIGGIVAVIAVLRRNRTAERLPVFVGTALAAVMVLFLGAQVAGARGVPPIHDITTDIADPPEFDAAVKLRGEGPDINTLAYDAAEAAAAAAGRVSERGASRRISDTGECVRCGGCGAWRLGLRGRQRGSQCDARRSGGHVVLVRLQRRRRRAHSAGRRPVRGSTSARCRASASATAAPMRGAS